MRRIHLKIFKHSSSFIFSKGEPFGSLGSLGELDRKYKANPRTLASLPESHPCPRCPQPRWSRVAWVKCLDGTDTARTIFKNELQLRHVFWPWRALLPHSPGTAP